MTNKLIYPVTGNPFVDTGQAVIACLAGKESFTQMNHGDVKRVFGVGNDLSSWNSRLKSFTMVFGNLSKHVLGDEEYKPLALVFG